VEEAISCFVTLASARQMLVKKYNGRNSNAPANSVADRRRRAALGKALHGQEWRTRQRDRRLGSTRARGCFAKAHVAGLMHLVQEWHATQVSVWHSMSVSLGWAELDISLHRGERGRNPAKIIPISSHSSRVRSHMASPPCHETGGRSCDGTTG
jgi:hypothetical protein